MLRTIVFTLLLTLPAAAWSADDPYSTPNTYSEKKEAENPLITIRFNQRTIYYQVPLYNAVNKALQVHPAAFFNIVSVIPTTGDFKRDEAISKYAAANAEKVVALIEEAGLPRERVQVSYQSDSSIEWNEVKVFVE